MEAALVLAQQGREFTSQDWSDRIGVLIGAIIVVLVVNGIGLYFIRRADSPDTGGPRTSIDLRSDGPVRSS